MTRYPSPRRGQDVILGSREGGDLALASGDQPAKPDQRDPTATDLRRAHSGEPQAMTAAALAGESAHDRVTPRVGLPGWTPAESPNRSTAPARRHPLPDVVTVGPWRRCQESGAADRSKPCLAARPMSGSDSERLYRNPELHGGRRRRSRKRATTVISGSVSARWSAAGGRLGVRLLAGRGTGSAVPSPLLGWLVAPAAIGVRQGQELPIPGGRRREECPHHR